MKSLLIIGAGGHGKVAAEIAKNLQYTKIDFLDDGSSEAIGTFSELPLFVPKYDACFCGIGNNKFRKQILGQVKAAGGKIATLIHPTAYVSPSAVIGEGTVVEPKAVVNTHSQVGKGSIISVGAIVDHDTVLGDCCHINAGAIVKAGGQVEECKKVDAGEVVLGF